LPKKWALVVGEHARKSLFFWQPPVPLFAESAHDPILATKYRESAAQ
jgi:hypothetical protein